MRCGRRHTQNGAAQTDRKPKMQCGKETAGARWRSRQCRTGSGGRGLGPARSGVAPRTAADAVSTGGAAHPRPAAKTTATAAQRRWQAVRDDTEQWRWRGVKTTRTPQRRRHAVRGHWRGGGGEGGQAAAGRCNDGVQPTDPGEAAGGGRPAAARKRPGGPRHEAWGGGCERGCRRRCGGPQRARRGPQGRRGLQADLQPAAAQAADGGPAGPPLM